MMMRKIANTVIRIDAIFLMGQVCIIFELIDCQLHLPKVSPKKNHLPLNYMCLFLACSPFRQHGALGLTLNTTALF